MGLASISNLLPVEKQRFSRLSKSNRRSFDCAPGERISRLKSLWRRSAQDDIGFLDWDQGTAEGRAPSKNRVFPQALKPCPDTKARAAQTKVTCVGGLPFLHPLNSRRINQVLTGA